MNKPSPNHAVPACMPAPHLGRAFKDSVWDRQDRYGQQRGRDSVQQVRPHAALLTLLPYAPG